MNPAASHLYRKLLRYGRQLQYTDKEYYFNRIRQEFQENRHLTEAKDIEFVFKVNLYELFKLLVKTRQ